MLSSAEVLLPALRRWGTVSEVEQSQTERTVQSGWWCDGFEVMIMGLEYHL